MIRSCRELSEEAELRRIFYSQNAYKLNEMIKANFDEKLIISKQIIEDALKQSVRPVVACSFGKDSVALLHLVKHIKENITVVFTNTGIEFRETIEYKEKLKELWNLQVRELFPKMSYWDVIDIHGFPKESRNTNRGDPREPACCKILKLNPMKEFRKIYKPDLVFVGLTAGEGNMRRWSYIRHGLATYFVKSEKLFRSIPLIFWLPSDIFRYFEEFDIPLNPAYKKYDIPRVGCFACTGYKDWRKEIKRINPVLYNKILLKMQILGDSRGLET